MMLGEPLMTLRGRLERDVDMARHVSWRAGGRADRMFTPADLDDLRVFLAGPEAVAPLHFVGLGSNLLVRDGGLAGTVIALHAALNTLRLEADGRIYAEAGVASPKLARFAARHDLVGAEFLAGIPGTVGGALAMNAGCYGRETWQGVDAVLTIDQHGQLHHRHPAEFEIGYRHVALKPPPPPGEGWGEGTALAQENSLPGRQRFSLSPAPAPAGAGEDVTEGFVAAWFRFEAGDGAAARETIKQLLAKRIASQPLNLPNAGSVFRNPPGDHAARLIESCGLKGLRIGGAQVSEKHANFIVNAGGATAADIEALIERVLATVAARTGIQLQREVRIIGER